MTFDEMWADLKSKYPKICITAEQLSDAMKDLDAVCVVRCKDCKWIDLCKDPEHYEYKGANGFCSKGERKEEPLNQHISQHVGFVGHGESNANALEPATGTPCLICGEFVEGWDFPICHECRKRLKNILYAPMGQLNPEEPFRELNCTIENDGTYAGG